MGLRMTLNLKQWRADMGGISQSRAAELVGVKYVSWNRWENGWCEPANPIMLNLALKALVCDKARQDRE